MDRQIDFAEIYDLQSEIIRLQSEIIDSLFMRLAQLMAAEELDRMPELEKISEAAELIERLKGGGGS